MRSHLSDAACADLATEMLYQSADKVAKHWPGKFVLCVTPSLIDPHFELISKQYNCEIVEQTKGDLGDRIRHVLVKGISEAGAAAVMGCDVPQIGGHVLMQAEEYLRKGENVIGPAEDGGFYLLGLREMTQELFASVVWGGDKVLQSLLQQSNKKHISFNMLESLRDIDRWEDLKWLAARHEHYMKYLKQGFETQTSTLV
jgi:rSAM/selenodomain-associated transferase 1